MYGDEGVPSTGVPIPRRRFLAGAAGVAAASLATGTAAADDCGDDGDGAGMEDGEPFSSVAFGNQPSDGSEIVVDATLLSDGGYVAIHDGSLLQGQVVGSVVGVSAYLDPGVHYEVPVALFDVPGADFDREALETTQPLIAMPHRETSGNQTYDFVASGGEDDGPYAEAGLPTIDAGFAVLGADGGGTESGPFATLEFLNQSAGEGTVVVRDVALSEGGFVTLHDARLLQGDPFGSVVGVSEYLAAGRHQAVEIGIDDPGAIAAVELPARPLFPMPHFDTNGNQEYDFVTSEGTEDVPYTRAGQAVIDAGLVTVA